MSAKKSKIPGWSHRTEVAWWQSAQVVDVRVWQSGTVQVYLRNAGIVRKYTLDQLKFAGMWGNKQGPWTGYWDLTARGRAAVAPIARRLAGEAKRQVDTRKDLLDKKEQAARARASKMLRHRSEALAAFLRKEADNLSERDVLGELDIQKMWDEAVVASMMES